MVRVHVGPQTVPSTLPVEQRPSEGRLFKASVDWPEHSRAPMFFLSHIRTKFVTLYVSTYNNAIYYTFIRHNV